MSTKIIVEISSGDLAQIVESVFGTMMNLGIGEGGTPWCPSGDRVTAAVHFAGEWNGAVLLECDEGQACRFAGRFLAMDPPDAVDDVVRDVLGELANMIGGNLKCVLMPGVRLSMPSVVIGSDYSLHVCGTEVRERIALGCSEGPFWVTLLQS
jgi:chemotaxis protein CheX